MKRIFVLFFVFFPILLSCQNQLIETQETSKFVISNDNTKKTVDVIILTGQSNMAGAGFATEAEKYLSTEELQDAKEGIDGIHIYACNDLAATFGGYTFLPYSNVTFGYSISSELFGPEVGFALECKEEGRSLVLIKYTAGGMPILHFLENNDLKNSMKTFIYSCLNNLVDKGFNPKVRAVCWMQGENDCDYYNATSYYDREKSLIKYLRQNFNENLIFIDAKVTDWDLIDPGCYQDTLNAAKEKIAQEDSLCYLINSNGLSKLADGAHYNTPSTIELGRRFAKEFLAQY